MTDPADKLAGRTGAFDSFAVVIVDNDRETLHMLVEQLRHEGAVVTCFRNAMLALAYAERHRVDGVLFNLDMPAADGWWFARQMRALPERSNIPVYAVGGRGQQLPDVSSGFAGYFPEPISLHELSTVLSQFRSAGVERPRHESRWP